MAAKLLSDNYPAVPARGGEKAGNHKKNQLIPGRARGGEMSDSHIGPNGLCAGLRKMFLRRK